MTSEQPRISAPLRLTIRLILTIALVWSLNTFLDRYFSLHGGLEAYIIIGSLLTLLNVLVRPVLHVILLPFKLFMGIIAIIAANAGFLWIMEQITARMDPDIVFLDIRGGLGGWLLIAILLGLSNWVMKEILR